MAATTTIEINSKTSIFPFIVFVFHSSHQEKVNCRLSRGFSKLRQDLDPILAKTI